MPERYLQDDARANPLGSVYNEKMSGEPTVLWWHWLAFGLVLVGAELVVPSFTIVWFGLAACLVGVLLLLVPSMPVTRA